MSDSLQATGYVRASAQNSIKETITLIYLIRAEVNKQKTELVNRIIINGSQGSFPSPQQASGVFD